MPVLQSPKGKKHTTVVVFIIIFSLLLFRLFTRAPQLFSFIFKLIIATLILFVIIKAVHRITAKKCASCGGPLSMIGIERILSSMINKDGGPNFNSISKRIFRCVDCGKEYHELIYHAGALGEVVDYKNKLDSEFSVVKILMAKRGDLANVDLSNVSFKSLTKEEYQHLKKELAKEVTLHNSRNGYTKNAIKIDL